jgi:hypothetical protein
VIQIHAGLRWHVLHGATLLGEPAPKKKMLNSNSSGWKKIGASCELSLERYESGDVREVIGDLFERSFRDPPPNFPVHYVCFSRCDGQVMPLGYGHCTPTKNYYLGGGMCTDNRALRKLSAAARREIASCGGVAQFLIEQIFAMSKDKAAVFSYVGHPVALQIDLRAGFFQTGHPHLIVHWTNGEPADSADMIEEVRLIGPF